MAGVSKDQSAAIDKWFAAKTYKCPMCGADWKTFRLNGTWKRSYDPLPNSDPNGGTAVVLHCECTNCAYVILVDCITAKIPYYK